MRFAIISPLALTVCSVLAHSKNWTAQRNPNPQPNTWLTFFHHPERPPRAWRVAMVSGIFHALFGSSPKTSVASFFDFKDVKDIDGHPHDFTQYRGKVVIVSNVASY